MFSSPLDLTKFNYGVKNGIQNYEVPPAPRKYSPPRYTIAPVQEMMTTPSATATTPISIEVSSFYFF